MSIAKAILYAVRQAALINQYGMTWEDIETNTANILAGCSVPADGKMNSAEAVCNHINGKRISPTPWSVRRLEQRSFRGPGAPNLVRWDILNANGRYLGHMRNESNALDLVRLVNSGGAVSLDLVDKYHAQKNELENQRAHVALRCRERDEARAERDKALTEAKAAQVDPGLVKHLQGIVRRQIDNLQRIQRERDETRAGLDKVVAEYNTLSDKNARLRTFLEGTVRYPMNGDANSINYILEETK